MKISNLRLNRGQEDTQVRLVCDIDANFTKCKKLYFAVKKDYVDWLAADVYDAFMVALLYPAMFYGENMEIDGPVSKKLYNNIRNYVQAIIHDFNPATHKIDISAKGFAVAEKNPATHVGTGFSAGVDSFSTITDRFWDPDEDDENRIDTLCFFHLGQYGNVSNPLTHLRAQNRFGITERFAREIGVKSLFLDTNLFDILKPDWEFRVGVLYRIASILALQKGLRRYYISNAYTYGEMIDLARDRVFLEEFSDPYIMPLLSPPGLEIVCDGAQYKRTEKTRRIADNPLVQRTLNVCVNSSDSHTEATNCGFCSKCLRTMMTLEALGKLDQFSPVFNRSDWEKHKLLYMSQLVLSYGKEGFATDNIDFARQHGMKIPGKTAAMAVVYADKFRRLPKKLSRALHKDS